MWGEINDLNLEKKKRERTEHWISFICVGGEVGLAADFLLVITVLPRGYAT